MRVTMDRYEADWDMVKRGWDCHVHGIGRRFATASEAIRTQYEENPRVNDQWLEPFVVAGTDGEPVGRIEDGDAVVFFNFRGDRAIEISLAFTKGSDFKAFDRGRVPKVVYAGMLQYDGDLKLPERFLVPPPAIKNTLGENLAAAGVTQYAISETQKYGHVTYFWNGNRSGKFDDKLEVYKEIPSDTVPFEQRPWMKAAEITDEHLATFCVESSWDGLADALRRTYGDLATRLVLYSAAFESGDRLLHYGEVARRITAATA